MLIGYIFPIELVAPTWDTALG